MAAHTAAGCKTQKRIVRADRLLRELVECRLVPRSVESGRSRIAVRRNILVAVGIAAARKRVPDTVAVAEHWHCRTRDFFVQPPVVYFATGTHRFGM